MLCDTGTPKLVLSENLEGRDVEGGDRKALEGGDIYIYPWMIHVDVRQKPSQYCKVMIFLLKIKLIFFKSSCSGAYNLLFNSSLGIFWLRTKKKNERGIYTHAHICKHTHAIPQAFRVHPALLTRSDVAQESGGKLSIIATASFSEDKKVKQTIWNQHL